MPWISMLKFRMKCLGIKIRKHPCIILVVVYIMDHEVVPCSPKICDWQWNFSQNHFGLHQGENVKVTVKLEVPKMPILRLMLFIVMVQQILREERQKSFSCYIS